MAPCDGLATGQEAPLERAGHLGPARQRQRELRPPPQRHPATRLPPSLRRVGRRPRDGLPTLEQGPISQRLGPLPRAVTVSGLARCGNRTADAVAPAVLRLIESGIR